MGCWLPLLKIFLESPSPESEASLWLQKSFKPTSNTSPISSSSFISLLSKPSEITLPDSSSPSTRRVMWVQTLPNPVQARIFSFLVYDRERFNKSELCKLARDILSEGKDVDFWVKKAARQLLDVLSLSNYGWLSHFNLDTQERTVEDEFESVPDWLENVAKDDEALLPWLPLSPGELNIEIVSSSGVDEASNWSNEAMRDKEEHLDEAMEDFDEGNSKTYYRIDPEVEKRASSLKAQMMVSESSYMIDMVADEIYELCLKSGGDRLRVLCLIEPWNIDDETTSIFISRLLGGSKEDELGWPSHVLCSVLLPKLMVLEGPASRALLTSSIDYCRSYPLAAENALLFPLILRAGGINNPVCDVVTRIVKDCLHPAHVSSIFQKILCNTKEAWKYTCLPCHRCLVSDELVWSESLFHLLKSILNLNILLTQDSVDQLVCQVCKLTDRYSKSLKFCNFLLCFISRCAPLLKPHKLLLTEAVEHTNTLVTKSILSKLSSL